MKTNIFVINGSGGKGKDTFIQLCSELTSVYNISSVDLVKSAAMILGWDGGKSEEDRLFLSNLKAESIRYNNGPYKYVKDCIEKFHKSGNLVMFLHIREPEEIDRVKKDFGCETILIKNDNVKDITSNKSDANVYNYKYDYIIFNDENLEKLTKEAEKFLNMIFNDD